MSNQPEPQPPTEPTSTDDGWADDEIAAAFGLSLTDFVEAFGGRWRRLDQIQDQTGAPPDPSHDQSWFVSGEPPQLLLRPNGDHTYQLAYPHGIWTPGTHGLVYQPRDQRTLPVADLIAGQVAQPRIAVTELLKKRRSGFRYCRYCRRLTPPELLFNGGRECMACASTYHGVVY